MVQECPGWAGVTLSRKAKYLGLWIGPDAQDANWVGPISKYRDRFEIWARAGLGLALAVLAYKIYTLPAMSFVAQLHNPPDSWNTLEYQALMALIPGPGSWIRPSDLHKLKEWYGMPWSMDCLTEVAEASLLRVTYRAGAGGSPLQVRIRAEAFEDKLRHTNRLDEAVWRHSWFTNNALANLIANSRSLRERDLSVGQVEDSIRGDMPLPLTAARATRAKKGIQSATRRLLRNTVIVNARERRLRQKLDSHGLPPAGDKWARRADHTLDSLSGVGPPRLSAALMRTWYQGWCTNSRFQRAGTCIWGCRRPDDSRSYALCPTVWNFAQKALNLAIPRNEAKMETFYVIHKRWTKATRPELLCRAALVAAIYRARNSWRASGSAGVAPLGLLRQSLTESVRGHPAASAAVDTAWVRTNP